MNNKNLFQPHWTRTYYDLVALAKDLNIANVPQAPCWVVGKSDTLLIIENKALTGFYEGHPMYDVLCWNNTDGIKNISDLLVQLSTAVGYPLHYALEVKK